uniref:hypothetical protein n=1 Tax=Vibrio parahaemolyticus TaxID=670 RepID=UPI001E2E979D
MPWNSGYKNAKRNATKPPIMMTFVYNVPFEPYRVIFPAFTSSSQRPSTRYGGSQPVSTDK